MERSAEIPGQADSAELPAGVRRKEVAVTPAGVALRGDTRGAAQDELIAHELAVVLPQGPGRRAVTGIGRIVARRPLPDVAIQLTEVPPVGHCGRWCRMKMAAFQEVSHHLHSASGCLPFRLRRQTSACPAREGIRLVIADMADRLSPIERPQSCKGHHLPLAGLLSPVKGRAPALGLARGPAVRKPQFWP